jgi:hypothetical protein
MSLLKTSPRVAYCSECRDPIQPGEKFIEAGGRVICLVCWGDP